MSETIYRVSHDLLTHRGLHALQQAVREAGYAVDEEYGSGKTIPLLTGRKHKESIVPRVLFMPERSRLMRVPRDIVGRIFPPTSEGGSWSLALYGADTAADVAETVTRLADDLDITLEDVVLYRDTPEKEDLNDPSDNYWE